MLTVATTKETPPGGWRITVEKTGHTVSHYDWNAFIAAFEGHCLANNIPLTPSYQDQLLDRMCRENPLWECKQAGKFKAKGTGSQFGPIMSFLKFVLNWTKESIKEGKVGWEEREVAQERANICKTCPYNTKTITFGCGGCAAAFGKLLALVLGKNMELEGGWKLGSCRICSCTLKVAVWMALTPQQEALDEPVKEQFRDPGVSKFCWKSKGL